MKFETTLLFLNIDNYKLPSDKTLSPEGEETEEPNNAIKPSPALKAKSESSRENAGPGSENRDSNENLTGGSPNPDKEDKDKDSTGSNVSAVAEPA